MSVWRSKALLFGFLVLIVMAAIRSGWFAKTPPSKMDGNSYLVDCHNPKIEAGEPLVCFAEVKPSKDSGTKEPSHD